MSKRQNNGGENTGCKPVPHGRQTAGCDAKIVDELLRGLLIVVGRMLACVPKSGESPKTITGRYPKAYDEFVRDLLAVVVKHIPGFNFELLDHELDPKTYTTISCAWKMAPGDEARRLANGD